MHGLGENFQKPLGFLPGIETSQADAQRTACPSGIKTHRLQNVRGLAGVVAAARAAGRDRDALLVQFQQQLDGFAFLAGESEADMARQTAVAMRRSNRRCRRSCVIESIRKSRICTSRAASEAISASASSAAWPNPTIPATFSVPERKPVLLAAAMHERRPASILAEQTMLPRLWDRAAYGPKGTADRSDI